MYYYSNRNTSVPFDASVDGLGQPHLPEADVGRVEKHLWHVKPLVAHRQDLSREIQFRQRNIFGGKGGGGGTYCKIRRLFRALTDKPNTTLPTTKKMPRYNVLQPRMGNGMFTICEATLSQERDASCEFLTRVLSIANGAGGDRRTGARECQCTQTRAMRYCCGKGDITCTLDSTDLPRRTRELRVKTTAIICKP